MFSLFELENGWMGRSIVPFELVDDLEARFMESISRDNRVESRGWKSNGQSFWQQPVFQTYIHSFTHGSSPLLEHIQTRLSRVKLRLDAFACFSTSLLLIQRKFSTRKWQIHPPSVLTYPVIKAVLVLIASCNNVSSVNNVSTLHDKQNVCRGTRKTRGWYDAPGKTAVSSISVSFKPLHQFRQFAVVSLRRHLWSFDTNIQLKVKYSRFYHDRAWIKRYEAMERKKKKKRNALNFEQWNGTRMIIR